MIVKGLFMLKKALCLAGVSFLCSGLLKAGGHHMNLDAHTLSILLGALQNKHAELQTTVATLERWHRQCQDENRALRQKAHPPTTHHLMQRDSIY